MNKSKHTTKQVPRWARIDQPKFLYALGFRRPMFSRREFVTARDVLHKLYISSKPRNSEPSVSQETRERSDNGHYTQTLTSIPLLSPHNRHVLFSATTSTKIHSYNRSVPQPLPLQTRVLPMHQEFVSSRNPKNLWRWCHVPSPVNLIRLLFTLTKLETQIALTRASCSYANRFTRVRLLSPLMD